MMKKIKTDKNNKKQKNNKDVREEYPKRVVFFDSFDEDFDGGDMKQKKIDGSYKYLRRGIFFRLASFFLYRFFAAPMAYIYSRFFMHERFIGKEKLGPYRGGGFFMYGNHTQPIADAFTPNIINYPRRSSVIISSKNFSLPVLGPILPMLGGIPLPTELSAARNFTLAVKAAVTRGEAIVIYPEAHLWPYCSFIRPFSSGSFDYPVRFDKPAFTFTRVYRGRGKRKVGCDIYIDGPFLPDGTLSQKEAREKLESEVRGAMVARAMQNEITVIDYKEKTDMSL